MTDIPSPLKIGSQRYLVGYAETHLAQQTLALILAGGRGSRLGPLTDWRAKPAVPFGGKFRIIDFALSNCINSGIRRIGVATQYKAQSLIRHIQRGWSFLDGRFNEFVELLPAQQRTGDAWYRGTADAVYQNLDILREHRPRFVLVLAGDHVYKMDYARMIEEHCVTGSDMTIGCVDVALEEATQLGVLAVDKSDRIVAFDEKPAHPRAIPGASGRALGSMGIYVFDAEFLYRCVVRDAADPASGHDFGHNIIPQAIADGYAVRAHRFSASCRQPAAGPAYWRDVGTVDAYWEANMELVSVSPALDLYDQSWPIWTHQEQLPPAKFVFGDDTCRGCAVDSMVSGGCIVSGALITRSLLFSGVRAQRGSSLADAVVLPGAEIGEGARLRRVVVDGRTRIPAGLDAGYDLEHDRARFHVTPRGVTLITPSMLAT